MEYLEFAWKIVEQQGILALILLLQVYQNNKERAMMVKKICTLQNFLMECLRLKMIEDSSVPGVASVLSRPLNSDDLSSSGTNTKPDGKVCP